MPPSSPSTRDLRIDFFRGLALIFIFWDHITGSFFGYFTMRNLGFSDAAELFVFLSGVSAAIAYGKRLQRRGYVSTTMHILSRSWTLYIAHVFVLTQLMAMLFLVNDHVLTRDYVNEMGLSYFLDVYKRQVPVPSDVDGTAKAEKTGAAVAFAGDFDGDGYGDYVIGSPGYSCLLYTSAC